MNFAPDGPSAIPLWINGRAFLTVSEAFFDVTNPASGEAIRRVPLCGAAEAAQAAAAAREATPTWAALPADERRGHLVALADALEGYGAHFAKLIAQETGKDEAGGLAEVAAAVAALKDAVAAGDSGVVAVVADAQRPLAAVAGLMAPALAAGATVVVKPSPRAPGAAFALCELTARAGWPAGVVNLLQGDEAAIAGLAACPDVDCIVYAGDPALGERIGLLAAGKPFASREA